MSNAAAVARDDRDDRDNDRPIFANIPLLFPCLLLRSRPLDEVLLELELLVAEEALLLTCISVSTPTLTPDLEVLLPPPPLFELCALP